MAQQPYEVRSGTVVPGSVDTDSYTVSILPSGGGKAIDGVLLNSTATNGNGVIAIPRDNSDVVIGTIDGPGEWVVLKTGMVDKVFVKIGNVSCIADSSGVTIQNDGVVFNVGTTKFRMNTGTENLYDLLKDLIQAIRDMSCPPTTYKPANLTTFEGLSLRLESLLTN